MVSSSSVNFGFEIKSKFYQLFRAISLSSRKDPLFDKNGKGSVIYIEEKLDSVDKKLVGFQGLVSRNKKSFDSENANVED